MRTKKSAFFGIIIMIAGLIFMLLCALAAQILPWLRVVSGLAGIVLFFVGFRFLGGPNYFVCPHCGAKIHHWNQWLQLHRKEESFRCPKCQTLLRTDGSIII